MINTKEAVFNMRVKNIKNTKITTAFKDTGMVAVEPLTEDEYDLLEKTVKKTKTPNAVHEFDEMSSWFLAKIPESKSPEERVMKDGTTKYSCPLILPEDNKWTSILLDADSEEVEAWDSYHGCTVAIVGQLKESKDGKYINIRGYRGLIIMADEDAADDEDEDEF